MASLDNAGAVQAISCPLCGSLAHIPVEAFARFSVLRCSACTLEFSDPLEYDQKDYDLAYREPASSEFVVPSLKWLAESGPGLKEARWMLFSAQIEVLQWLKSHMPQAGILDIGCGSGWFLARAKQLGFQVAGVEIGSAPVALLQQKGFRVVCGSLESVPPDWQPDVVTLFEVLEHLPDPAGFIRQIRARFPGSTFMLSVPSPRRWTKAGSHRDLSDYPPNHLTRWNVESLRRALANAGYRQVQVKYSRPRAIETASVSIKTTLKGWWNLLPDTLPEVISGTQLRSLGKEIAARRLKCIPGFLGAGAFRALGWSGISLWAIAQP